MKQLAWVALPWLGLGLGLGCGQKEAEQRAPVAPVEPVVETPLPAGVPAGERLVVSEIPDPIASLPELGLPPLVAPVDAAAAAARYGVATSWVKQGKHKHGLAALRSLLLAPDCRACVPFVERALRDASWKPLRRSIALHAMIEAWDPPTRDCPSGPEETCAAGTTRKGDDASAENGTSWCEKPGGVKHGWVREWNAIDDDAHDMREGSEECFIDGLREGDSGGGSPFEGTRETYVEGRSVGVSVVSQNMSAYDEVSLGFSGGFVATWHRHKEERVLVQLGATVRGEQEGAKLTWSIEDGVRTLTDREAYRAGKRHGQHIVYDTEAGAPRRLATYENGVLHGRLEYWDAAGTSLGASTMTRGDGLWIQFGSDDRLIERGTLENGQKTGPWIEGEEPGSWPTGRGSYLKGRREGPWIHEAEGKKTSSGGYVAGKRHGRWIYYNADGVIRAQGMVVAGVPDGRWTVTEDGEPVPYVFKAGALLSMNGEPFVAGDHDYSAELFVQDPERPEERHEDDH